MASDVVSERVYNCSGCGQRHGKPTGKRCKRSVLSDADFIKRTDLNDFMSEMRGMFSSTQNRLNKMESSLASVKKVDDTEPAEVIQLPMTSLSSTSNPTAELVRANKDTSVHVEPSGASPSSQVIELSSNGDRLHSNDSLDAVDLIDKNKEMLSLMQEMRSIVSVNRNAGEVNGDADQCLPLKVHRESQICSSSAVNSSVNQLDTLMQDMRSLISEVRSSGTSKSSLARVHDGAGTLASTVDGGDALASIRQASAASTLASAGDFQGASSSGAAGLQTNNNAVTGDIHIKPVSGNRVDVNYLRDNQSVVAQAAKRLADLGIEDAGKVHAVQVDNTGKGRKSGAVSRATDQVRIITDWPHYHIVRGPNLTPSSYEELSLEEFVLGYIRMINDRHSVYDSQVMWNLLEDLLEDAIDFSWTNAKAFYKSTGLEVERGLLSWNDLEAIHKRRMIQSRIYRPNVNANVEKKTPKQMPPGSSCCALYQTGACDKKFDHTPYVHACAFCWKHKGTLFKHREIDCYSMAKENPKN